MSWRTYTTTASNTQERPHVLNSPSKQRRRGRWEAARKAQSAAASGPEKEAEKAKKSDDKDIEKAYML